MNDIKAIFFDFDGVMTIDKTGTLSICSYISKNFPIDKNAFEKEYRKYNNDLLYGNKTHDEIWDKLCSNLNKNIPISILYDSFANTQINYKMYDFVKQTRNAKLKTGLITDNIKDRIKIITEKFKLSEIFDAIIVSSEIGFGKDNIKIFEAALEKINVKPNESIFIDNYENNLIIPKNMGINTIYYDDEKRDIGNLKNKIKEYGVNI